MKNTSRHELFNEENLTDLESKFHARLDTCKN